jgi:tetratricopeptide (TPR) repeat protein
MSDPPQPHTPEPGADGAARKRLGLALAALVFLGGAGLGGVIIARLAAGGGDGPGRAATAPEVPSTIRSAVPAAAAASPGAAPAAAVGSPAQILEAAQKMLSERRYDPARGVLERGVQIHPADQSLRLALAEALLGLNQPAKAYEQFQAAIALGGSSVSAKLQFEAGTVANSAGLVERAEEHYAAAQMADPRDAKIPLYLAMIQLKRGNEDGAAASLVRAVTLNPELTEGWGTLGELHLKQGKVDLALQHLAKARALSPTTARWVLAEARARKRQGDAQAAIMLLTGLTGPDASSVPVLRTLAECHAMLGDKTKAAGVVTQASDARPADPELAFEAALWLSRAGEDDRARTYAQRAAERGYEPARKMLAGEPER